MSTALVHTPELPTIEVWENLNAHRNYVISISVPEFTSVCPKTGLPDFGTITLDYVPDEVCVELKAFKYYILGFRNMGIFYENVVNKILDDVVKACNPRYLKVTGDFTARGGIATKVVATHVQPGFDLKQLPA
jgi:7-cyano-7-deazaguanine reductase